MLLSMTGYGKGERSMGDRHLKVEIKSLNGKMTDLRLKMPTRFREKEMVLRKRITEGAIRGKMDVAISVDGQVGEDEFDLNISLFKKYLKELKQVQLEEDIASADLIGAVMKFPNVVQSVDSSIDDQEWDVLSATVQDALSNLYQFRKTEGAAMEKSILDHIHAISSYLEQIDPLDKERFEKIRKKIRQKLDEHLTADQVDENRMEQEILFYLEKLDITEEKVRLSQHCNYFLEILKLEQDQKGKKLGFISQEMGREINTLGAKAQSSDMQKLVVGMKDELEKIKELIANSL